MFVGETFRSFASETSPQLPFERVQSRIRNVLAHAGFEEIPAHFARSELAPVTQTFCELSSGLPQKQKRTQASETGAFLRVLQLALSALVAVPKGPSSSERKLDVLEKRKKVRLIERERALAKGPR
ncbi:MAG TPA: hypothetical protein VMW15_03470 [Terracidiphilus sp.]|nr:hypothetical protein [Terracidiphilus sp.]